MASDIIARALAIKANKTLPAISSADAGKLATVDSNGKWAAADLEVGQGEVAVDSTLLVTGAAADAKATGDKVNELKSALTFIGDNTPLMLKSASSLTTECNFPSNYRLYRSGAYVDNSGVEHALSGWNIYKFDFNNNVAVIRLDYLSSWSNSSYSGVYHKKDGTVEASLHNETKCIIGYNYDYVLINISETQKLGFSKITLYRYPDVSFIDDSLIACDLSDIVGVNQYETVSGTLATLSGARVAKVPIDHNYDYYIRNNAYQALGNKYASNDQIISAITISSDGKIALDKNVSYIHANISPSAYMCFKIKETNSGVSNKYPNSVNKPIDFENKSMVAFGDSITTGVCSPNLGNAGENSYINLFVSKFGINLSNLAVSGSTITHVSSSSICDKVASYSTEKDIVLISGGVNDYNQGQPLGQYGDTTNDTFYGALNVICNALKTNLPNATVIFISPLPETKVVDTATYSLNAYRNAIYEVATTFGFNVVNGGLLGFTEDEADWGSAWNLFTQQDGLHPTVDGHKLYFRNLCNALC